MGAALEAQRRLLSTLPSVGKLMSELRQLSIDCGRSGTSPPAKFQLRRPANTLVSNSRAFIAQESTEKAYQALQTDSVGYDQGSFSGYSCYLRNPSMMLLCKCVGLTCRQLTGQVAQAPKVLLRRSAQSDHQTEPGLRCPGGAEAHPSVSIKKSSRAVAPEVKLLRQNWTSAGGVRRGRV